VTDEVARLEGEIEVLRAENSRLRARLEIVDEVPAPELDLADAAWDPTLFAADEAAARPRVTARSAPAAKVALFRSLFGGRTDVYATRWTNRQGRSGWSPAVVGGPANARKPDRQYRPLTDDVVAAHLTGGLHIGLYPLLPDDTCRLLACDFDGPSWRLDAGAFIDAAQSHPAPGCPRALPVRERRPCLDVLRGTCAGPGGPAGGGTPAA
jgi:hypothetical protein